MANIKRLVNEGTLKRDLQIMGAPAYQAASASAAAAPISTTITQGQSPGDGSITLASTLGLPSSGVITLLISGGTNNAEIVQFSCPVSGSVLSVSSAYNGGKLANTHTNGDTVLGFTLEHGIFCLNNPSDWGSPSTHNYLSLRSVYMVPEAAVTGAATNNFALYVIQYRAGAPVVGNPLAVNTFASGNNASARTPLYLAPTAGNVLQSGDMLTYAILQNGTGMAIPAHALFLDVEQVYAH